MTNVPLTPQAAIAYARGGLGELAVYDRRPGDISLAYVFFCFVIPLASNALELVGRWCSHTLFDPFPTVWHALFAIAVPAINMIAYLQTRERSDKPRPWLRLWLGVSIGSAVYFSILFAPLLPVGIIGIIAAGLGLLILSPMFGLYGACLCLYRVHARTAAPAKACRAFRLPTAGVGAMVALAALVGGEVRKIWTQHHAAMVIRSTSAEDRAASLEALRAWGDAPHLLDTCLGRRGNGLASAGGGWDLLARDGQLSIDGLAGVYYRLTGRTPDEASSDALPGGWRGAGERPFSRDWNGWVEDNLRGRDVVGAPIAGLSLADSHFNGTVHADAATAYVEWILDFDNQTTVVQEARCRVALPAGGVVSRVTLWINGKECEAAYGSSVKVREAYQSVAVVQRRDPVLVTGSGPGHVMLQCFPVPARGRMQTKIGVTIPLRLTSVDEARFSLPSITERNFACADPKAGGLHRVTLDAGLPLRILDPVRLSANDRLAGSQILTDGKATHTLSGRLSEQTLGNRSLILAAARRPDRRVAWGPNPFEHRAGQGVIQELSSTFLPAQNRIQLVVDGSAAMKPVWTELCDTVAKLPAHLLVRIDLAADRPKALADATPAAAAAFLRSHEPIGGQDALPALEASIASARDDAAVLWIRGPQAVLFDSKVYKAGLEARPKVTLQEVVAVGGVNRVAESLAAQGRLTSATWEGSLGATIDSCIGRWAIGTPQWQATRRPSAEPPPDAVATNIDLARLWGNAEVDRLLKSGDSQNTLAAATGAKYRLVTAVSGAVVLENQEQYDAHDLSPVSVIPLPPAVWAVLAMLPLILIARRSLMRRPA